MRRFAGMRSDELSAAAPPGWLVMLACHAGLSCWLAGHALCRGCTCAETGWLVMLAGRNWLAGHAGWQKLVGWSCSAVAVRVHSARAELGRAVRTGSLECMRTGSLERKDCEVSSHGHRAGQRAPLNWSAEIAVQRLEAPMDRWMLNRVVARLGARQTPPKEERKKFFHRGTSQAP